VVKGIPYDTPIPGYRTITVNRLRLWKAEAVDSFDLQAFDTGDYIGAVREKMQSETISKVLYPSDDKEQGKRLRLQQQYFFTSCSLQDMIRIHLLQHRPLEEFHQKWSVQLNDTHPSIGIAELMRLLIDERGFGWDTAWNITQQALVQIFSMGRVRSWMRIDLRSEDSIPDGGRSSVFEAWPEGELAFMNTT
jgi:glycogen phosphorylase